MTPQEQLDWYNANSHGVTFTLDDDPCAHVGDDLRDLLATFEGHTFKIRQMLPREDQHTGTLGVLYDEVGVLVKNLTTWADPLRVIAAMYEIWYAREGILRAELEQAKRCTTRLHETLYGKPFDSPRYCDPKLQSLTQGNTEVCVKHHQTMLAYGTIHRHHDTPTDLREGWTQDGPTWNLAHPDGRWYARVTEPPGLPGVADAQWTWVLRTHEGHRSGQGPSLRYVQNAVETALWEVDLGLDG